jgi:hypothetical protein
MVRIIVTTEHSEPVLFDEHVGSEHLTDGHAADQLVQRLRWAVTDAEDAERAMSDAHSNGNGIADA